MTRDFGAPTVALDEQLREERTVITRDVRLVHEEQAELVEAELVVGPIGRLGRFAADHLRAVLIPWAIAALTLAAFAPKVETALSGAGWEADGSESVQARMLIQQNFAGLSSSALTVVVHSSTATTSTPAFEQTLGRVEGTLAADKRVGAVQPPRQGATISPDGHTAIVTGGAQGNATAMVAAAEALKSKVKAAGTRSVEVSLTGSSG